MSLKAAALDDSPIGTGIARQIVTHKDNGIEHKAFIDQSIKSVLMESDPQEHYLIAGKELLDAGMLPEAELFAIEAIKAAPGLRKAYDFLSLTQKYQGDNEAARICSGFALSDNIIEKYFHQNPDYVDSNDSGQPGLARLSAYPSVKRKLSPPKHLTGIFSDKLKETEIQSAEAYTVSLKSGRLWYDGHNIVVWDKQGRLVKDLCRGNSIAVNANVNGRNPTKIAGQVALLGSRGTANYYHWMNDALPRVGVLQGSGIDTLSVEKFVVSPVKKPFHQQTLAGLSIDQSRLFDFTVDHYIEADDLLIPMFGNQLGKKQDTWLPEFLRSQYAPLSTDQSPHKKIYISRGSSGARGIVNEEELISLLVTRGFHIAKLEDYSFAEQVSLFSGADIIFGPHGAGFTNTVFCKPGTSVVELYGSHVEPCFWITSELMGFEHYMHYCNADVAPSDTSLRAVVAQRLSSLQVDLGEVEAILELAGVS